MNKNELLSKSDTEIIELCKKYKVNYLQKNGKKPYKKETLIKLIMTSKFTISKDINKPFIQNISNKESLKNKIHDIHNFLRNNGVGYGMNALKVFNVLYGLKKIEENNLLEKFQLSEDCKFSSLVELSKKHSSTDVNINQLVSSRILKEVLDELSCQGKDDKTLREFLFYEIPKNISPYVLPYLVREIDTITEIEESCNVDLSGKIYEYFIGRDKNAISELGAYFTERRIVNYIYENLLMPSVNENNEIYSMIDMFGGSGGFTIGYIKYLQKNYTNINWSKELHKIYHYDMNDDVVKYAAMEFLCLTKELPNMKENVKQVNSFYHEFYNNNEEPIKFKYIITNPPYGGDDNAKSDTLIKNNILKKEIEEQLKTLTDANKIKNRKKQLEYIKNTEKQEKEKFEKQKVSLDNCGNRLRKYAKDNNLSGNDKESCSLIQLMNLLDDNGTCIGVLKEGVFFNSVYKNLREFLLKNFNVRKIISVPSNVFENTATKTSILVFDNTEEKTSYVEFYELIVNKYTENKFEEINDMLVLTECIGDIYEITDALISKASIDEILENSIKSLNGKDYKLDTLTVNEGYELIRLGDIVNFLQKSKRPASFGKENGLYNFYSSSEKVKKCDELDYKDETIIIGTGGNSCIHIDNKFSCSADTLLINPKIINIKYLYYNILSLWDLLINKMHGSTIKHITKDILVNHKIPIPKSQDKIKEWVDKISTPYNEKNNKQKRVEELEEFVKNKIKEIEENEDCKEVMLGDVCEIQDGYNFYRSEMDNNNCIKNDNLPLLKVNYPSDHNIKDYVKINEKYKKYIIYKNDLVIGCTGTCGVLSYVKVEKAYHVHGLLKLYNFKINKNLLYYTIKHNIENFKKISINKTVIPYFKISSLKTLKIKIPKDEQIIKNLEPTFNEIEKLKEDIDNAGKLYERYIKELREDAINTF